MIHEWEKVKRLNRNLKLDINPCFADDAEKKFRKKLEATWHIDGESPGKVVAIGYNPSTAGQDGNNSDLTVTRLAQLLDSYGFDNFTIINLFENVSSDGSVDDDSKTDFENHRDLLEEADIILVVWGISKNKFPKGTTAYKQRKDICNILLDFDEKKICCLTTPDKKDPSVEKCPVHPGYFMVSLYDFELVTLEREDLEEIAKNSLRRLRRRA